ncbi:hypothetical protein J31TS6_47930 [Brevibacillus reuszeri]|nr:hypothetical protein J31TS6_47930 [Brevibacillus reuszeri]
METNKNPEICALCQGERRSRSQQQEVLLTGRTDFLANFRSEQNK